MGERKLLGIGGDCPKCGNKMNHYTHGENWMPRQGQAYYFIEWYHCDFCGKIKYKKEIPRIPLNWHGKLTLVE